MTIAHTVGHITLNDVRQALIPKVDRDTQDDITARVRDAHAAKTRARHLLEAAKRGVEIAVEESEDAALEYLSGK
jgi:type I restriction enzyme S subunit